jgi:general secretion pathway protein I
MKPLAEMLHSRDFTSPSLRSEKRLQRRPSSPSVRGFSLLEVLVAFAILALTLGVLLNIFSGGLRNLGDGQHYTRAVLDAQSKLAEIGVSRPLAPGEISGEIDDVYRWSARISPLALSPGGLATLYQVDLTVKWGEASAARAVRLQTLKIGPPTS